MINETDYIVDWLQLIITERLSSELYLVNKPDGVFLYSNNGAGYIQFPSISLQYLSLEKIDIPCVTWKPESEGLNSILGGDLYAPGSSHLEAPVIRRDECNHYVGYDVIGMFYWVLSRREEMDCNAFDVHGRFISSFSHAHKYGYVDRPIVDEWVHILKQVIKHQWPNTIFVLGEFSTKLSHDVDIPSLYLYSSLKSIIKAVINDFLREKKINNIWLIVWARYFKRKSFHAADPFNSFDWIMDESEKHKLSSAFYFICGKTDEYKDANYDINDPAIVDLIKRISNRGHEIGLHPSYNTFNDETELNNEFKALKMTCENLGIKQKKWGGRMHYLRWKHPQTLQNLNNIGYNYDSTLGYADCIGFRCGTCFDYTAIDPSTNRALNIRIRPLIVMDVTFASDKYMGLGYSEKAVSEVLSIKQKCRALNGSFNMLWHNNNFTSEAQKTTYKKILEL